jgi:heme exporter protein A
VSRTILSARALTVQRGDRILQRGLDIGVQAGEIVWLRGRNGSGKTSLLRVLAGVAPPAAGQVERQAPVLLLSHLNALHGDLSAIEALAFLAGLQGKAIDAPDLKAALGRLGIDAARARQPVRTLSQGQRRRVALARLALPAPAPLWLLDEPYDALDDSGIRVLDALLSAHAQRGGAVLLTSHQALTIDHPSPRELMLAGAPAC